MIVEQSFVIPFLPILFILSIDTNHGYYQDQRDLPELEREDGTQQGSEGWT